jgi:hypothetical protein
LQDSQVKLRGGANQLRRGCAAVAIGDANIPRALNHVMVRHDQQLSSSLKKIWLSRPLLMFPLC